MNRNSGWRLKAEVQAEEAVYLKRMNIDKLRIETDQKKKKRKMKQLEQEWLNQRAQYVHVKLEVKRLDGDIHPKMARVLGYIWIFHTQQPNFAKGR